MSVVYDRFKKEIAVLMTAIDTEMQKEKPMPHYLFEKIAAIERQVSILKSWID